MPVWHHNGLPGHPHKWTFVRSGSPNGETTMSNPFDTEYALDESDVGLDECEEGVARVWGDVCPLDGGIVEVVEVVGNDHPLALVQEPGRNVAADKTCTAGDQYAHLWLRAGKMWLLLLSSEDRRNVPK